MNIEFCLLLQVREQAETAPPEDSVSIASSQRSRRPVTIFDEQPEIHIIPNPEV